MPFTYDRTIRFHETDAAGVVYFTNVLVICHEAYEASLIASGVNAGTFFRSGDAAMPIVHASVEFFKPMYCGDRVSIQLLSKQVNDSTFEICYEILGNASDRAPQTLESDNTARLVGKALTRHVCIAPQTQTRTMLSSQLINWLRQTGSTL
ncbi:acyl-CoA thioesterase [Myxacorys almedinensis]|uniref:1,4-dihydroxy-2-naphthoyl-CoA hydrolase n=1 Tax=Myxacorys almedinensis A TaxID=2690445 RepID=A0A8J8CK14_9CYAN|nr:thioesterase family protein [Myxacorys almedinensis]NDJ16175.1 1,4-dihydroxy-2-naphthoyl-CoA hydrolase [Myxacorys almedinensis A]